VKIGPAISRVEANASQKGATPCIISLTTGLCAAKEKIDGRKCPGCSVGSRVYLFDETAGNYVSFKMVNKEFTFNIDTSVIFCGSTTRCTSLKWMQRWDGPVPEQQSRREVLHRILRCECPRGWEIYWKQCDHWLEVRKLLL
jgi:hypothetical protein